MLDTSFWKSPRFSAASAGIMLLFFAMFGSIFLLTQYLQYIMNYTALQAGIRLLPMALTMLIVAPLSARIVERLGTKTVVASGLGLAGVGLALFAGLPSENISYWGDVAWRMVIMAAGMGLTMAPATESIMGSLPLAKAGAGSAVNDTTRQLGGTLGVAALGSVFSSAYGTHLASRLEGVGVTSAALHAARESVASALAAAAHAPGAAGTAIADAARDAFMSGFGAASLVAVVATAIGIVLTLRYLPARASRPADVTVVESAPLAVEGETAA